MFCFPRHRERVPALGNHPGTRRLPGYRRASLRLAAGPGPRFLCLSALGVPYAGGEPAHRGIYPITCLLFNEKKGTPIKV